MKDTKVPGASGQSQAGRSDVVKGGGTNVDGGGFHGDATMETTMETNVETTMETNVKIPVPEGRVVPVCAPGNVDHATGYSGSGMEPAATSGARDGPREKKRRGQVQVGRVERVERVEGMEPARARARERPPGGWATSEFESLILQHRLIPTVRLFSVGDAVPLARALARAGLPLLQIELTTPGALAAIAEVRSTLAGFAIGAGTVLSPGQIGDAIKAGALFGAGSGMHADLLKEARSVRFPFLPGAMTPSEIECGMREGFSCQCLCPAVAMGGPAIVRALVEPYLHTPLMLVAAGGLQMADFQEYLTLPRVAAVAGEFVCERALIEAGMWEDIEAQALLCRRKAGAVLPRNSPVRAGSEDRMDVHAERVLGFSLCADSLAPSSAQWWS